MLLTTIAEQQKDKSKQERYVVIVVKSTNIYYLNISILV